MEGQSSKKNNEQKVHVKFFVPQSVVGVIIGKGGSMIKNIQEQFEVKLFVDNMGEVQTMIGIYGPEGGVRNATETIMKILLSLRIIQIKLDEMGKPRTLRYVEEMTFLSLPEAGQPAWFVNLNKERIQLENCDRKMQKQTEAAKTDTKNEFQRGRPILKLPAKPIDPEKSTKSKSKAPPCLFKVKVVPKTESGLPDDRYKTEAIALSVRTPMNYGLMVGTLRSGVENLPENFHLFVKIDNEWTKIPRPKKNENDTEIWDEYFVNTPKANRVLYLVEMSKVKKTKPDDEETKPEQKNPKTEAEMQALAEKIKSLELKMATEKSKNMQQSKEVEEQKRELVKLRSQQEAAKEKPERAGRNSDSDREMGLKTNAFQDFNRIANGCVTPSNPPSSRKGEQLNPLPLPFRSSSLGKPSRPNLIVNPTACTVPATGGEVTFQLFNPGPQRLVYNIKCRNPIYITVNSVYAFVEAGATSSLRLTCKAGRPKEDTLLISYVTASPDATDARAEFKALTAEFKALTRYEYIKIPVLSTADNTVTTLTTSYGSATTNSSKFSSSGTVNEFIRPSLIVTPTACTAPAYGGEVTFQLFNTGTQRLVYSTLGRYGIGYTVSPAYAFIEAGATACLQLTRKSGPPQKDKLDIVFASALPDATDAVVAFQEATIIERIEVPLSATA